MIHNPGLRFSAILFTALYLIAAFVPTLPEGAYSDTRVHSLLEDGGSRAAIIVGGFALAGAGVAFLVFTACLSTQLGNAGRRSEAAIVRTTGTAYGTMAMVASTLFSSSAMGRALDELPESQDTMLFRTLSNAGFHALLVGGLLAAAVLVAVTSIALRRGGLAPTWCVLTGLVIAPMLLLGFAWVPQFLVCLWMVVVAFGIVRPPEGARA